MATEGGAIISVYGLLVGMFIYKEIRIRDLPGILLRRQRAVPNYRDNHCGYDPVQLADQRADSGQDHQLDDRTDR